MRAPARIVGLASGLALVVGIACERDPGGFLGPAPASPPIRLVDLDARITGPVGTAGDRPLLRLDRRSLRDWAVAAEPDAVRFSSPLLAAEGMDGAARLQLRVQPGGAHGLAVIPFVRGSQPAREHRAVRRLELSLEPGDDPDAPLDLSIDLHEALHGSIGDGGRGGRLEKLEILLLGADPARAAIVSLAIEPRRLLPASTPAVSLVVDHQGILRPTWAVRGGAQVEIALQLPPGSPEIRWTGAAMAGTGARIVELVHDAGSERLSAEPANEDSLDTPWKSMRSDLTRWAGEPVRIHFRVEAGGVGLFGDPIVLTPRATALAPDVVVYLIDTLRADHLGIGGAAVPGVSPNLDRLARKGVWFQRAQSSSPWTKPAIATLMSGILPPTHRVGATSYTDRMPPSVPLLQERFRDAGWRTGSFSASPLGSTLSALERGFDTAYAPRFWRARGRLEMNPSADQLQEALLDWAAEQPDRPFFAYLHTLEVHEWKLARYQRGRPSDFTAYHAAILDADRHLGALVEALEQRGRPFWLVVTSDHGESWGDHGLPSHGFGLHQSQIHIPLLFFGSDGRTPRKVATPVSLADVGPTLLDGFGLPALEESDGESLLAGLRGEPLAPRAILSALLRFVWAPHAPKQYALTTADQQVLIRREGDRAPRAFDLVVDPGELRPLTTADPSLERTLDALLARQATRAERFNKRHGPSLPGPITLDDAARLRALGYLGDSAPNR